MVKNPPAIAEDAGDTSVIPDPGRSCMLQSSCWAAAYALEPESPATEVHAPYSQCCAAREANCSEKPVYCNKRVAPLTATREKPAQQEDQAQLKIKSVNK